jgi:ubiquinone/menaquinone biosynthesis C-methylase UbiE
MSMSSRPEKTSTYLVQDRSNLEEMRRIEVQDQVLTINMGGALPEQPDPTIFKSILDVGCGTGVWLIEAAKALPSCSRLVGVDISRTFVDYARGQAEAAGVSDRVEFLVMDALIRLEFRDNTFDLVNHRFSSGWLRTWDWPKIVAEYQRICNTGGVVRITEPDLKVKNSSPAFTRLLEILLQALHNAGHLFTAEGDGITNELASMMNQFGLQEVQTYAHTLEYTADSPLAQSMRDDARLGYRNMLPFFRKWTQVPDDYDQIYQQAMTEIQQPDFVGMMSILTAWGKV